MHKIIKRRYQNSESTNKEEVPKSPKSIIIIRENLKLIVMEIAYAELIENKLLNIKIPYIYVMYNSPIRQLSPDIPFDINDILDL